MLACKRPTIHEYMEQALENDHLTPSVSQPLRFTPDFVDPRETSVEPD